jgi:hypothetical protein
VQRRGDFNTTRFWRWFEGEANGLVNGVDADWQLIDLNTHISGYDPDLVADVRKLPDHTFELAIRGTDPRSAMVLVLAAPRIAGWRISAPGATPAQRALPFDPAPSPSPELCARISGLHETLYAETAVH